MQKLTKAEIYAMEEGHQFFVGSQSNIKGMLLKIDSLETGEGFMIDKKEWKMKSPPNKRIRQSMKNLSPLKVFSTRKLVDGSAWVITREQ